LIVHQALHSTVSIEPHSVHRWLNLLSGVFLMALGLYILRPRKSSIYNLAPVQNHGQGCGCASHKLQRARWSGTKKTSKTVLVGFAVGLIPCPSALAALSTALTSRDLSMVILIIAMFSLGIFLSLTLVGSVIARLSTRFHGLSMTQRHPRLASQIQFVVFVAVGIWHISLAA
jgi:ABC-type nickel/cobalt efflux system permease component RcnA